MNKILIAEDEGPIANLVKTALSDAGYECVWAEDGNAAADLLESTSFDLVQRGGPGKGPAPGRGGLHYKAL